MYTTYARDALGRITLVAHRVLTPDSAHTITHYYNRDALGRVLYQGDGDTTGTAAQTLTSSAYTYSHTGEVSAVIHTGGQANEAYTTDLNGNRTTNGGTAQTVGANNQIASDGKFAYEYDDEGNRVSRTKLDTSSNPTGETTVYEWDHRDRLTRVTVYAAATRAVKMQQVEYTYDCYDRVIGERVKMFDTDANNSLTSNILTQNIFDGDRIVAQTDANGQVINRYLWLEAQMLAEELGATNTSPGTLLWALSDQQNTTRDFVNTAGEIVDHLDFDSFGNIKSETNTTSALSPLVVFGENIYDRPTKTLRADGRVYDPLLGEWESRDPIGFAGGLWKINDYCGNDPVNRSDSSGFDYADIGSAYKPQTTWEWVAGVHYYQENQEARWHTSGGYRVIGSVQAVSTIGRGSYEAGYGDIQLDSTFGGGSISLYDARLAAKAASEAFSGGRTSDSDIKKWLDEGKKGSLRLPAKDLKADDLGLFGYLTEAALKAEAGGVSSISLSKEFPIGPILSIGIEGGVDVKTEDKQEHGKKETEVTIALNFGASVGLGHNITKPSMPHKPGAATKAIKDKDWWRKVLKKYEEKSKEWREFKKEAGKTEPSVKTGFELSHDDLKDQPLGWRVDLSLGVHAEAGIWFIGIEAEAGYHWMWSGSKGYLGGSTFASAHGSLGSGNVGAKAEVFGKISGSYSFAVLDNCSSEK